MKAYKVHELQLKPIKCTHVFLSDTTIEVQKTLHGSKDSRKSQNTQNARKSPSPNQEA